MDTDRIRNTPFLNGVVIWDGMGRNRGGIASIA